MRASLFWPDMLSQKQRNIPIKAEKHPSHPTQYGLGKALPPNLSFHHLKWFATQWPSCGSAALETFFYRGDGHIDGLCRKNVEQLFEMKQGISTQKMKILKDDLKEK